VCLEVSVETHHLFVWINSLGQVHRDHMDEPAYLTYAGTCAWACNGVSFRHNDDAHLIHANGEGVWFDHQGVVKRQPAAHPAQAAANYISWLQAYALVAVKAE
jgi:hypothetical protein